jgi:hypothetical protein
MNNYTNSYSRQVNPKKRPIIQEKPTISGGKIISGGNTPYYTRPLINQSNITSEDNILNYNKKFFGGTDENKERYGVGLNINQNKTDYKDRIISSLKDEIKKLTNVHIN